NWGLRSAEIDLDALANHLLEVRALKARMRDGTLVSIPEERTLDALDLKGALAGNNSLTVYLAVPVANLGKANVGIATKSDGDGKTKPEQNGVTEGVRFLLGEQPLEDENTGVNPQPIQVRLLNLKLLLDTEDHAGYEVLPICRVQKSAKAEGTPELDRTYIPP